MTKGEKFTIIIVTLCALAFLYLGTKEAYLQMHPQNRLINIEPLSKQ